jgi:DNA-binding response OmpR family regulator
MRERKIAIIDDDEALTFLLRKMFEEEGFIVITCNTTNEAYKRVLKSKPDLAIVDSRMPTVGGNELIKMFRRNPITKKILIIMLTVESSETYKVAGFENGADDYVTKPFSKKELLVRVKSLLRRAYSRERVKKLECDGLKILLDSKTITLNGKEIFVRPKEFDLLHTLMSKPNVVLNREFILENIFEYNSNVVSTRTIDTHIKNLRHVLGPWSKHIVTVFGSGFKFIPSLK